MISTLYLKIWKNKFLFSFKNNPITILIPIIIIVISGFVSFKITSTNINAIHAQTDLQVINTILNQSLLSSNVITLIISVFLFFLFKNNFFQSSLLRILPISNARILLIELLPFLLVNILFICILYVPTYFYIFSQMQIINLVGSCIYLLLFFLLNITITLFSFLNIYFFNNIASYIGKLRNIHLHEPISFLLITGIGYIYYKLISESEIYSILIKDVLEVNSIVIIIILFVLTSLLFYLTSLTQRKAVDSYSKKLSNVPFTYLNSINIFLIEFKRNIRDYHRIFTVSLLLAVLLLFNYYTAHNPFNSFVVLLLQFSPFLAIEILVLFPLIAGARDTNKTHILSLLPISITYIKWLKLLFYVICSIIIGFIYNTLNTKLSGIEFDLSHTFQFLSELILLTILAFIIGTLLSANKNTALQEGIGLIFIFIIYFFIAYTLNNIDGYYSWSLLILSLILFLVAPFFSRKITNMV